MSLQVEPDYLVTLAMETFGKYVHSICLSFIERCNATLPQDRLLQTCQNIRKVLCETVPPSLVNEVTSSLLKQLDYIFLDIQASGCRQDQYPEVIRQIVSSIIHPATTRLDFGSDYFHELYSGFEWNLIDPFVCRDLSTLKNLRQLRVGKMRCCEWDTSVYDDMSFPESLEEFTFLYYCDNNVLKNLAKSCRCLKRLNVSGSSSVTNAGAEAILKFQHLQQLDVEKTGICREGVTKLLNGLAKNEVPGFGYTWSCSSQVLSLGCSDVENFHLEILVAKFTNLAALKLSGIRECNLLTLRKLENLKMLSLSYGEFSKIEKLLQKIGNQLELLDVCDVGPINMKAIGESCSSLKCLHIASSDTSTIPALEDASQPLPGFRSVVCLCLHLEYNPETVHYVLSQCVNVKTVDITIGIGNDNAVIKSVLKRNPLNHLEVFNWWSWSTGKWTRDTTREIIEHCPNLRALRGPYVWLRNGDAKRQCVDIAIAKQFQVEIL